MFYFSNDTVFPFFFWIYDKDCIEKHPLWLLVYSCPVKLSESCRIRGSFLEIKSSATLLLDQVDCKKGSKEKRHSLEYSLEYIYIHACVFYNFYFTNKKR